MFEEVDSDNDGFRLICDLARGELRLNTTITALSSANQGALKVSDKEPFTVVDISLSYKAYRGVSMPVLIIKMYIPCEV